MVVAMAWPVPAGVYAVWEGEIVTTTNSLWFLSGFAFSAFAFACLAYSQGRIVIVTKDEYEQWKK